MSPPSRPPGAASTEIDALHARLLAGDAEAGEEICRVLLPVLGRLLTRRLQAAGLRTDAPTTTSAAGDALVKYVNHPARYDPGRGRLEYWLVVIARNIVLDSLRHEADWRTHEVSVGFDVLDRTPGPDSSQDPADDPSQAARVQVLAAAHTATEHAFLSAKLDGVRGTEARAAVHRRRER